MNAPSKIAAKLATEIGKPENVDMISAQLARHNAQTAAFKAAAYPNDEHANRVLARVKADAAALRLVMHERIDEEPNHGPLWDDHDVASVRAAAWDGSL